MEGHVKRVAVLSLVKRQTNEIDKNEERLKLTWPCVPLILQCYQHHFSDNKLIFIFNFP
jgi:hypothetical protein